MTVKKQTAHYPKLSSGQIDFLKERMLHLAQRNPSAKLDPNDYRRLYYYLAAQKITSLYDDELFEKMDIVDNNLTGKQEELLDAYMVLDVGDEIHLKLFQFKFTEKWDGGISTKELYAFVDRMNRVFQRGDLQDERTLEAFKEVRLALEEARKANKKAKRTCVHCYYIVNGQNVSPTDAGKVQEIRDVFSHDRQNYGFFFETYGGVDLYELCAFGRIPIQDETLELNYDMGDRSFLHHNIGTNPNGMPEQVLVGFVNVNQLIRLVDRYGNNELFEKNVRLFLGAGKEVNRKIIETVTSNQSAWFGFMNNGVSITSDTVVVDSVPSGKKVKLSLNNMQIINGCQTVNALYHAKYNPELKDSFQGNSNVMVRIYQVDSKKNRPFLDALIIATNSQNAIRPEDLLSNDAIQCAIQKVYQDYGVGYERKEGEILPEHGHLMIFSKEQAAMAYMGVYEGSCSKLRNSLSRREFFRQGHDYFRVFNLRGETGEDPDRLPDDFTPGGPAYLRALQIFAARVMEEACREKIVQIKDKLKKGSLRKGAYYLARIVYVAGRNAIDAEIGQAAKNEPKADIAKKLKTLLAGRVESCYAAAQKVFEKALAEYLKKEGGNEDAALKNTAFATLVDDYAEKNRKKSK